MENIKEARLSIRIDEELKEKFFAVCEAQCQTPSKVIKAMIKEYIEKSEKK